MFSFSVTKHTESLSSFRFIKVVRIRILVEEEGGHRVYMGIRYHVDQLKCSLSNKTEVCHVDYISNLVYVVRQPLKRKLQGKLDTGWVHFRHFKWALRLNNVCQYKDLQFQSKCPARVRVYGIEYRRLILILTLVRKSTEEATK